MIGHGDDMIPENRDSRTSCHMGAFDWGRVVPMAHVEFKKW